MSVALQVILAIVAGAAATGVAVWVIVWRHRQREPEMVVDRAVLEERLAWLEEHYGVDSHKVFVEGTAIVAEQPEQRRPVQRG
jgi:hypothetical protein